MTTSSDDTREPRPVEELCKLDSYQGMSDEEIDMLTNYKLEIAIKDEAFQATMKEQRMQSEAKAAAYRDMAAHANAKLDALISTPLELKVIDYGA